MDKVVSVVVGLGLGGGKNICKALDSIGVPFLSAGNRMWPRDHYVLHNGFFVKRGWDRGYSSDNVFGEGGAILAGKDFILVSDYAFQRISEKNSCDYDAIKKVILKEAESFYQNNRIYVAPTGYYHGKKGHFHIDMFCNILPNAKILLLDTHFGNKGAAAKEYDEIAEREGLRLLRIGGNSDGVWYPLNFLVLDREGKDVAVLDSKAKSLIDLLKDEGIDCLGVDLPQIIYPGGKIRCQTNVYDPSLSFPLNELLEDF